MMAHDLPRRPIETSSVMKAHSQAKTVTEVADLVRSGALNVDDVPIDFVVRNGNKLILNTRSAQVLTQAGVPRSRWNAIDRTGDVQYEARLNGQLKRNKLTEEGTDTVRRSKSQD